jgi:hypothetical protein
MLKEIPFVHVSWSVSLTTFSVLTRTLGGDTTLIVRVLIAAEGLQLSEAQIRMFCQGISKMGFWGKHEELRSKSEKSVAGYLLSDFIQDVLRERGHVPKKPKDLAA